MALYRPIVDISGNLIELPDGDYIKPNLLGSNIPTVDTVLTGNNTWVMGASFNYWTKTGNDLSYVLGNVGIGTILPQALGHFYGDNAAVIIQSNVAAVNTAVSSLHIGQKEASPNIGLNANYRLSYNSQNFTISYASSGGITGSFSERLRINSSGNVGIGTDNPTVRLEVVTGSTGAYFTRLSGNVGVTAPAIGLLTATTTTRINSFGDALQFFTGAVGSTTTQKMAILSSGEVGIGVANPSRELTLKESYVLGWRYTTSNEGSYHRITGGGANPINFKVDYTSGVFTPVFTFDGNATNILTMLNGGNVGIGTPSPSAKLEINQDANETGLLVTGGSSGLDMARFVRDIGGNVTVGINGSGGDAQIYFTTTGNTFAIGTDGSSFKISDSVAVGTNDRLTIDSNGNVGIGTTNPYGKFTTINTYTDGTNSTHYVLDLNSATTGDSASIDFNGSNINLGFSAPSVRLKFTRLGAGAIGGFAIGTRDTSNVLVDRLYINHNNGIGINTNNPDTYNQGGSGGYLAFAGTTPRMNLVASGTNLSLISGGNETIRRGGIAFTNGSNIEFSTNTSNLGTNISTKMIVLANGNVGIGTTTPTEKLHVVGSILQTGFNTGLAYADTTGKLVLATAANVNTLLGNNNLTTNFVTKWGGTAFVNSQIFDNGVNVGIGTNSPTDLLHINAASNGGILLAASNAIKGIQSSTGSKVQLAWWGGTDLVFGRSTEGGAITNYIWRTGNANADKMTLNATGLGIGVSSPAQALHVFTATPYQIQVQRSGVASALIGVSSQTPNSTGDLFFDGTQASQGFVFRSRDVNNVAVNSLGIDRNGNVGIGIYSPSSQLHISGEAPIQTITATNLSSGFRLNITGQSIGYAHRIQRDGVTIQATSITGNVGIGNDFTAGANLLISKNIEGAIAPSAIAVNGIVQAAATQDTRIFQSSPNVVSGHTLPVLYHFIVSPATTYTGTVTTQYGVYIQANLTGATNNYGIRSLIPAASGTNRWNLFMDGTAPNYMAGSLGIGTTSLAGHGIRNSKTITGGVSGFSHANYSDGQIQSDVIGAAWYFRSFANTQPTAFTLPDLRHFEATQGTIGAGSSVTVQTAFLAGSTLVGASFANYGFRGAIPAGTGRWNAFMDGTAYNLLAGRTFIGSTAENGSKVLQVNGGIRQTDVISGLVFANAQGEFATATAANIAATLGAGNYIQNQVAGPQASANFYIDGYGRADTFRAGQKGYLGTYTGASQLHGIWTLSSTYVIDTSLGTFGNQYGLAYGHTNNTGGVALPDGTTTKKPITGWGHQILFTENGIVRSGISLTNGNTWQAGQAVFGNYSTTLYGSTSYSIIHPTAESYLANNLQIGKTGTGGILRFRRPTDGLLAGAVGFIDNNTINITSFGGGGIISFTTSNTEKMRITGVGRLLVGYNADVNTYKVQINSGSATDNGLYVNGHIRATGNIIADGFFSGTSSDLRYKSNFEAVKVLNVIDKINVYSYNHKLYNDARLIGSVAQELEKHFPQLITKDTNGYLRVDNYGYSALALQLGKEIKSEVDLLKDRVKELEAKIQTLEKK